jgi:hypothetical protein
MVIGAVEDHRTVCDHRIQFGSVKLCRDASVVGRTIDPQDIRVVIRISE